MLIYTFYKELQWVVYTFYKDSSILCHSFTLKGKRYGTEMGEKFPQQKVVGLGNLIPMEAK